MCDRIAPLFLTLFSVMNNVSSISLADFQYEYLNQDGGTTFANMPALRSADLLVSKEQETLDLFVNEMIDPILNLQDGLSLARALQTIKGLPRVHHLQKAAHREEQH